MTKLLASWKTTLVGVLGAIATAITMIALPILDGDPATSPAWGEAIPLILTALGIGWFARDDDKSSESVGAK